MPIDPIEAYRDSNKATMEYGKNTIQFSFLLNGAAATALFAKTGTDYLCAAIFFATGAGTATFCMGMGYILQFLLTETWRQKDPVQLPILGKTRYFPYSRIENIRLFTMLLWIFSMIFFICGIVGVLWIIKK